MSPILKKFRMPSFEAAALPAYLASCLLLGGASAAGIAANALLEFIAIAILAWYALSPSQAVSPEGQRTFTIFAAVAAALALVELLTLPPAVWPMLPGRRAIAGSYALLGLDLPWLPLSLDRDRTIASLLALLPPLAIVALGVRATASARRNSALVAIWIAVLEMAIGGLQLSGGTESGFYPYEITNRGLAVGLFANRNHMASLLLMTLPFIAIEIGQAAIEPARQKRQGRLLFAGILFLLLVTGLLLNGSSAALTILAPMLAACWFLYRRETSKSVPWSWALIAAGICALLLLFALFGPFHDQFLDKAISSSDPTTRRTSSTLTLAAARDFLPFGSGLGSFLRVYPRYEDLSRVTTTYVNHAHNDLAELLLETGLIGAVLLAAFLIWLWRRSNAHWRAAGSSGALGRAASIAILAVLAHSLVDYPLRTEAIAALCAYACAMLSIRPVAPPSGRARHRPRTSGRHLTIE